ncbi:hypothetical protein L2E82_06050 [Cichorium intybus]|uniref:Uncharacterized protein n=1 Tax=Cichorium intybus TaxID=13427 RepID=A0ACB9H8T5_CICIN|nr:hypothetical protein L2E82_06050 [Cichorium intybus]
MNEDPLENEVPTNHTQSGHEHDNIISTVETSQEWNDRRDHLASTLFSDWSARHMAGRSKHTWTNDEDSKLIAVLLELHVFGKYGGADNGFKLGYLKAVQQLLDASLSNSGLKAEPHIKSRMKTWKNHFSIVHDMVVGSNMSGFGWDPIKCCVTADNEVWDEYIKSHKGAACFRDKPFPQYDDLCKVFGKDRATGSRATDLGEDDVVEETQKNSPIDVEGFEDVVEETPPTTTVTSKRKRSKTADVDSFYKEAAKEMKETFEKFGDKLTETIRNIGKEENKEACDMIDKVTKDIQSFPNINIKQRLKAINTIAKDQSLARSFLNLSEEEKICYVEMIADGSIA